MDPNQVQVALSEFHNKLQQLTLENNQLKEQLMETHKTAQAAQQQAAAVSANNTLSMSTARDRPDPKVKSPDPYSGNPAHLREFVDKIENMFTIMTFTFPASDHVKRILTMANLLTGSAHDWYLGFKSQPINADKIADYPKFLSAFQQQFQSKALEARAISWLEKTTQGRTSVHAFTSTFRLKIADAGWDDKAARDLLRRRLHPDIRKLLLSKPSATSLDELVTQATDVAASLEVHHQETQPGPYSPNDPGANISVPMDIDAVITQKINAVLAKPETKTRIPRGPLDDATRKFRMDRGLCLYVGCTGHMASDCPLLKASQTRLKGNASGKA
jgi:hypothetical protein